MTRHSLNRLPLLLLVCMLAACTAGPTPTAAPPTAGPLSGTVTIGALLSPPSAAGARNAITLAQDQINEGRLLGAGVTLSVVFAEDQGHNEDATTAAFKLINGDNVVALIGPQSPFTSETVAGLAQAAGVPLLAYPLAVPALTAKRPFVFRTTLPEARVISRTVEVARSSLALRSAALLFDESDLPTENEALLFSQAFAAQGITLTPVERFRAGDTDFAAALGRIRDAKVDALVVVALPEDAAHIVAQLATLGLTLPVIGGPLFNAPAGAALAGAPVFGGTWCACAPGDANASFVAAYTARFAGEPDEPAAAAYTATWLAAYALKISGRADRTQVRDALESLRVEQTPLGAFAFDETRAPEQAPLVLTVKDGKLALFQP
jgi:branched-chain amino acid transport system substrate-binding protein